MKPRSASMLGAAAAAAFGLASCATNLPNVPEVGEGFIIPEDFRVVGYFPSWSGNPELIRYRALTHICYAFVHPTMEGGYRGIATAEKLMRLTELAHANGVKVLASLGGWNDGTPNAYDTIAADPELTEIFLENTKELIDRYGLDGIDMDWEFPKPETARIFADLMIALGKSLRGQGKILSIAVSADERHGGAYLDDIEAAVDFVNIMAYDDGFEDPPGKHHSPYHFAKRSLDYWLIERGLPKEKATLGVPFYGRSLLTRRSQSYARLLKKDRSVPAKDISGEYAYNGFDTIRAKTVNQARVRAGGIMVWQLNQDSDYEHSLLNVIFDSIKEPVEAAR